MIRNHEEKLADLFPQYTSIYNTLWSVYAATTAVLLGLSISGMVSSAAADMTPLVEASVRAAVSVGFGFFSLGNLILLLDANRVLVSLRSTIEALPNHEPGSQFHNSLSVIAQGGRPLKYVPIYHLSIDFCVFVALWVPFFLRIS